MYLISVVVLFDLFINGVTSFSSSTFVVPRAGMRLRSRGAVSNDIGAPTDTGMEKDRIFEYVKFGHTEWLQHRSSDRFYTSLLEFDKSPILKNLLDEALVLGTVCAGTILWNGLLVEGFTGFDQVHYDPLLVDAVPSWLSFKLTLPTDPFFLSGGPLGLLLVFRNNACFERYNRALLLWETSISSVSNMLLVASRSSKNVEEVRSMGIMCWALMRTLQHEVLGEYDSKATYEENIRRVITDKTQADKLLGARNKLHRAKYDVLTAIDAFSDETDLVDIFNDVAKSCSECKGLYTFPIPLPYTRWTEKFLTVWITFMPFAFYDVFAKSWNHILLIPSQLLTCFLFFGIEEIAVSLEEPFSILPLDEFVEEIYENIEDTTKWMEEEQELSSSEGYEKKKKKI